MSFLSRVSHFLELGLDIVLMTLWQPDKRAKVRRDERVTQMSCLC